MSRPNSDVAICNLALSLLKEAPISVLTGSTMSKTEVLCAQWYDLIRQTTLEAYNWNFALLSAAIPRGGDPAVSDYEDYYVFPNNYLKLRAIEDPSVPLGRRTFEIQGRNLYYDTGGETSLDVWYTKDETDIAVFPALFIKFFAEELAIVLGMKLTARPSIIKSIKESLAESKRLALAANGQMRPPKRFESSRIVNAGRNISSPNQVAGNYEFEVDPN